MSRDSEAPPPLLTLVGRQLSSVTFVRDYIQFGFDGPVLNAIVDPVVHAHGETFTRGQVSYNNEIISLIDKRIVTASIADSSELRLVFQDSIVISISLRAMDLVFGPEAAILYENLDGGRCSVWP